jgi:Domain of unknown function (DUF4261)
MVVSTSPSKTPVQRPSWQTRVLAALTQAGGAIGVYEGEAHATIEVLTLGMAQLLLLDLLLVAPAGQGNDALASSFDFLKYVLSLVRPLTKGETVGRTASEKLPVTYAPSPIDPAKQVMKVELPGVKKKRWPFGGN